MAEFTETFNLRDSAYEYKNFIARLRILARDPNTLSHQLPVLLAQQNPPTRFFDVVLRTERRSVRLRIRRDNLYLDGYRDEDGDQWYEFNNGRNEHLIAGSTFLGFTGTYTDMQTVAGQRREEINLGQQQLNTAVNDLIGSTDRVDRARALIVIIQMICESIRFTYIINEIAVNYIGRFLPNQRIVALENGWGSLSGAVLHDDNHPGPIRLPTSNDMGINNIAQAIIVLGILLRQHAVTGSRSRRDVGMETTAGQALILDGRPLVEVFYVRILNIDGEDPGQLYGIITVTDGLQSYYIYNRVRANYESISSGEHVTLIGLSRVISAEGDFIIDFNFMDSDSLSRDDEISRGQIIWNVYDHINVYDKLRTDIISGKYGSAALNYVVMNNAAEILLEVILINGDGEDPADIYKRIYSQNFSFDGKIELFRKSIKNYVNVHPGSSIFLLKSALAVLMDASFKISAYLWDHNIISSDDEIARKIAEFKSDILKSAFQFIEGQYGKVEVRVSWI
jgi:hypothetical protein